MALTRSPLSQSRILNQGAGHGPVQKLEARVPGSRCQASRKPPLLFHAVTALGARQTLQTHRILRRRQAHDPPLRPEKRPGGTQRSRRAKRHTTHPQAPAVAARKQAPQQRGSRFRALSEHVRGVLGHLPKELLTRKTPQLPTRAGHRPPKPMRRNQANPPQPEDAPRHTPRASVPW